MAAAGVALLFIAATATEAAAELILSMAAAAKAGVALLLAAASAAGTAAEQIC